MPGVYRIATSRQQGYQAQIRRGMYDSTHNGDRLVSHAAAVEWYYTVRRLLDLPYTDRARAAVHRSTRQEAYIASVTKWFNGGDTEEGMQKAKRAAARWRRQAIRRIKEAGL